MANEDSPVTCGLDVQRTLITIGCVQYIRGLWQIKKSASRRIYVHTKTFDIIEDQRKAQIVLRLPLFRNRAADLLVKSKYNYNSSTLCLPLEQS